MRQTSQSSALARVNAILKSQRPLDMSSPVISVGSLRCAGSSTLALTLASIAAASDFPVLLIDAAANDDLVVWSAKASRPDAIQVVRCDKPAKLGALTRQGHEQRCLVVIDAGGRADMLRMAARLASAVLIPVRFSPLSACAAAATDTLLTPETHGTGKRRAFVATSIAQIPSRIARGVEAQLDRRSTERLGTGLAQRAAFEAPFMFGGTIFTLSETQAPSLHKAQEDALALATELDILRAPKSQVARRIAETILNDRRKAA